MKTFARALRRWREEAGLTQKDVARSLGHAEGTGGQFVSNWERGISIPPIDDFGKLARLYRVPMREFVGVLYQHRVEQAKLERRAIYRRMKAKQA